MIFYIDNINLFKIMSYAVYFHSRRFNYRMIMSQNPKVVKFYF
jgi:hypothetical protein